MTLSDTTLALADGMREAAGDRPVQVSHTTGLLTVFFSERPVHDYAGAAACDTEGYGAWCRALLARGVYPPPSQFEAWFPSLAHTPEHVDAHARGRGGGVRRGRVSGTLGRLADSVREAGGLLAATVAGAEREGAHGQAAAAGPRAAGHEAEYALLVEEIREGYLQHYGEGARVRPDDPDLALLAGDRLFALGLARLAELGRPRGRDRARRRDLAVCAGSRRAAIPGGRRPCGTRARARWARARRRTTRPRRRVARRPVGSVRRGVACGRYCSTPARLVSPSPCPTAASRPSPSTPPTGRSPAPSRARRSRVGAS